MRKHRPSPAETVATLDPTLPAGCRPLTWGVAPSADARLYISGIAGVWAFAGGVEYGRNRYVEVTRWQDRGQLWQASAPRYVAPLERVFVLADGTEERAR